MRCSSVNFCCPSHLRHRLTHYSFRFWNKIITHQHQPLITYSALAGETPFTQGDQYFGIWIPFTTVNEKKLTTIQPMHIDSYYNVLCTQFYDLY